MRLPPTAAGARALAALSVAAAVAAGIWYVTRPEALTPAVGAAPAGSLRVAGRRIRDDQQRQVTLRGFNDSALLPRSSASPLDARDAELMQESGFDLVRLPIAWSLIEPQPGQIDHAYLTRIRQAVELFGRHRIWSILDMHFGIAWGPGSNVPAWAQASWAPDLRLYPTAPWRYSLSPRTVASEAEFWTSGEWQGQLLLAWQAVAKQVRDLPWFAGYDLYNEPHPLPIPPLLFSRRFLFPLYARLIAGIGSVDASHLFLLESTLFDSVPTPTEPVHARNIVYSPHLYTGSLVNAPWHWGPPSRMLGDELDQRLREAAAIPAPLLVGELGVDHGSAEARAWTADALRAMAQRNVGWAWWQWRQDDGWGVRARSGRVDWEALELLAFPYVRAAPAGLTWRWDGSRLTLRSAHAVTAEVSWPSPECGSPRLAGACTAFGAPPRVDVLVYGPCELEGACGSQRRR